MHRIQLAHVIRETGRFSDALPVTLEDREIGDVEAHECRVEPPISFGQLASQQIASLRQPRVQIIERGEKAVISLLIGGL